MANLVSAGPKREGQTGASIEQSIEVNLPVTAANNQWTQFEDFPCSMEDITEVRQLDNTHLHWVAEIGGKVVEWDAEPTEQKPSTSGRLEVHKR